MSASHRGDCSPAASENLNAATRAAVLLRFALIPVVAIGSHANPHPEGALQTFDLIVVAGLLYSIATAVRPWGRLKGPHATILMSTADLAFVIALAFTSGPTFPQMRAVFTVVPMIAALRVGPARTAAMSAVSVVAYFILALTLPLHPAPRVPSALAHSLFIVWAGGAAVTFSFLRRARERRIEALARERGLLVAQTLEADERARKQLANVLHDNVIQDLLVARQDLIEARDGDAASISRVEHAVELALCQLRLTIDGLDPYALDHLGFAEAIEAIARRAERHGRCAVELVQLDTVTDAVVAKLVVALAREFLTNAAKHAEPEHIRFSVQTAPGTVVLSVSDDGKGFSRAEMEEALRNGHIGLAASRERVEAVGGRLTVTSRDGGGTTVTCVLPSTPPGGQTSAGRGPAQTDRAESVEALRL